MTAEQLPAELATWPAWTPGEEQLGELELLTSGAFAPLAGYLTAADLAAVRARGELADGTPWPVPVTLTVPGQRRARGRGPPGAAGPGGLAARRRRASPSGSPARIVGAPGRAAPRGPGHGAARRRSTGRSARCAGRPPTVRGRLGAAPVLALRDQAAARPAADRPAAAPGRPAAGPDPAAAAGGRPGRRWSTRPEALVRAVLAAGTAAAWRARSSSRYRCRRAANPAEELRARAVVAAAYGATHLPGGPGGAAEPHSFCGLTLTFPSSAWRSWPRASGPTTRWPRSGGRSA